MAITNPLIESDILTCPHKGIVQLKSSVAEFFSINGVGVITQNDLQNAKIIGCCNNIMGVPTPCVAIATIPSNAIYSDLEIDTQKVILHTQISIILTDKAQPLTLQSKAPNDVYLDDSKS